MTPILPIGGESSIDAYQLANLPSRIVANRRSMRGGPAVAAMLGVLGIGLGYWWTDAVAAGIISLDILYDGFKNLKRVVFDLMDRVPTTVDRSKPDPLPERVRERLLQFSWISDARVRMREEGHVYFGEALVVVADDEPHLPQKLTEAAKACTQLHWRVHDIVLSPVPSLSEDGESE